jgi:hypothetical protein
MRFWHEVKPVRTKYGAKHVSCDLGGRPHSHDSMAERSRHHVLYVAQGQGEIRDLKVHQKFKLEVNGVLITSYEADFTYWKPMSHLVTVEDVKGVRTREFMIKARLMLAVHGITIIEVP